ncbi:propanediol/glycerol family dehydratase large subunit, partial [Zhenhengia sp.]
MAMKRSKRMQVLDGRPVNQDGFINEWPEKGFVAMASPYDPVAS